MARDRSTTPVDFAFARIESDPAVFQVLVADLAAGPWSVACDGKVIGNFTATPEAGTIYFTGPAGAYRLTPAAGP
jgi:hypothetical protein